MCGITGIVSFRGLDQGNDIKKIIKMLKHRGPDHAGIWFSPDGNCVLGHARLSVIDLSPAGEQPMLDPVTGNAISYNGEIFNFQELRGKCVNAGYQFNSQSDTEVILALYREYGVSCVDHLRGMFAFAIWDAREQRLVLARDRLGEKPLNYTIVGDQLLFASEIRALVNYPSVSREIDTEALELFLELQYIPAPWTIYKSIRKLLPGHLAIFDRNGLRSEHYWDLDYRCKIDVRNEAEAVDLLDERLRESIRIRMVADVPIGSTLSGGVDSSLVVAMMAGLTNSPVRTFTISFKEGAFDESRYALEVARKYGTDHHVYTVESDIEDLLPKMAEHYGEPYGDKGAVPAFYVSRCAREKVTVALNGDGGDELLGGYPRYQVPGWRLAATSILDRWRNPRKALSTLSCLQTGSSLFTRARRRLLMRCLHPELQSLGPPSSLYWGDGIRDDLLGGLATDVVQRWRASWLASALEHAHHPIDRMLWLDTHTYLRDDGLVKMDIASNHCSLEARTPLVDHKLVEFCASLPARLKIRNRTGKYLLKVLAERYLPKHLIYRRKQGFAIPVDAWLRGPLLPYLKTFVLDAKLMAPLNMELIRRIVEQFLQGKGNHSHRIWLLLIYGIWRKTEVG